jgi:hypothetical protein
MDTIGKDSDCVLNEVLYVLNEVLYVLNEALTVKSNFGDQNQPTGTSGPPEKAAARRSPTAKPRKLFLYTIKIINNTFNVQFVFGFEILTMAKRSKQTDLSSDLRRTKLNAEAVESEDERLLVSDSLFPHVIDKPFPKEWLHPQFVLETYNNQNEVPQYKSTWMADAFDEHSPLKRPDCLIYEVGSQDAQYAA